MSWNLRDWILADNGDETKDLLETILSYAARKADELGATESETRVMVVRALRNFARAMANRGSISESLAVYVEAMPPPDEGDTTDYSGCANIVNSAVEHMSDSELEESDEEELLDDDVDDFGMTMAERHEERQEELVRQERARRSVDAHDEEDRRQERER